MANRACHLPNLKTPGYVTKEKYSLQIRFWENKIRARCYYVLCYSRDCVVQHVSPSAYLHTNFYPNNSRYCHFLVAGISKQPGLRSLVGSKACMGCNCKRLPDHSQANYVVYSN